MTIPSGPTGSFFNNQFFSAGLGLFGIGTGIAILRQSFIKFAHLLSNRYVTSLEITSKDPSYGWILNFIGNNCKLHSRNFSLTTSFKGSNSVDFHFTPSIGSHYLQFKHNWLKFTRTRQSSIVDLATGQPFESITISTLGKEKTELLKEILSGAQKESNLDFKDSVTVYTSFAHEWRIFGSPKRARNLESVILQGGVSQRLLADVNEFLSSSEWYYRRGVPFRRSYLLYGPPGTGKSSFIHALASHLNLSIALINFNQSIFSEDRIGYLFNNLPERTILLMEDIDRIFDTAQKALTPSGLLNALDGVASSEGRIIFMTTNHLEKLDEALTRAGRIDIKQFIGNANCQQATQMFRRFFPEESELSINFGSALINAKKELSPATLQGILIMSKNEPQEAIKNLQTEIMSEKILAKSL